MLVDCSRGAWFIRRYYVTIELQCWLFLPCYFKITLTAKMFGAKIFGENILGEQMFGWFFIKSPKISVNNFGENGF